MSDHKTLPVLITDESAGPFALLIAQRRSQPFQVAAVCQEIEAQHVNPIVPWLDVVAPYRPVAHDVPTILHLISSLRLTGAPRDTNRHRRAVRGDARRS